jgi:peptidoglycan/xylan/chitin deacetylase (PgdA/CDA1 family)
MKIATLFVLLLTAAFSVDAQTTPKRLIAFTIDDLPVVSTRKDINNRREITKKILGHIKKARIPAIGFVNEGKLYSNGKLDDAQVDLLLQWAGAGLELGNHSYSHKSLNAIDLAVYEKDILDGETVTKELMKAKGKTLRYFRHPYLQTGLSLQVKADLGVFLKEHGYTIAPVTIDNADWIFASAYDKAFDTGDKDLMKRVGEAYVPYMESKIDYWERQSFKLFGREVRQILLIHANFINSDYLDDLAKMLKKRGYEFVTLAEALKDEAYLLPDTFIKRAGISWLHRWALDRGRETVLPDEPKVPDFVMKAAGVDSE